MGFRVGIGYDTHKLQKDRKLILGGVLIPHETGLMGHSDADVLVHALMDALFGACGLRDIGTHFPDSDSKFKNISSIKLLEYTAKIIYEKRCRIKNIDLIIVAEKPKISPFVDEMIENISKVLDISKKRINIKATTEEGLGFVGRLEGISAHAVCLVKLKKR